MLETIFKHILVSYGINILMQRIRDAALEIDAIELVEAIELYWQSRADQGQFND